MPTKVIAQMVVLKHARGRESVCQAWGEEIDAVTGRFIKITCTECDGEGQPKGEETLDQIHDRVFRHTEKCTRHYAQRARRCVDAERKGDHFDCAAALH
ncbi:hypothetical protein O3S80_16975 [Streptomyces sp. Lzd4kr]|nr:hypothetical protein [Streptomyces sp. Lzd4kr]